MHKFVRDLITEWRKLGLPFAGETILVAVSGGADSLSLLLALDDLRTRKKLDLRLVAAHFNHKLRGAASDADEEFVRHLATEKAFELAIGRGPVSSDGNIEQNAREARYGFLHQTAQNLKAFGVATAHTMNDQAETFLLNLIRGSGPDGLSGMKAIRALEGEKGRRGEGETGRSRDGKKAQKSEDAEIEDDSISASPLLPFSPSPVLVRPLLSWARREDTENFCRECGVEFRYDTMNEDISFKRVRVRKMLIPVLKDLNPKIIETLARTARLMSEPGAATGLSAADRESTHPASVSALEIRPPQTSGALSIAHLKTLRKPDLYQTLRSWLRLNRGDLRSIGLKHIESIELLLHSPKSGRMVELPGGATVSRHGGRLSFGNIGNIKVD